LENAVLEVSDGERGGAEKRVALLFKIQSSKVQGQTRSLPVHTGRLRLLGRGGQRKTTWRLLDLGPDLSVKQLQPNPILGEKS